ncbi:hypothetical protein DJ568_13435 [Mucilaginibacter hurinus]|uniref:SGNH hydrolase-type esterase domain-containing protein n=1 Tax=Mucilaginibacter hurinus TaxID=2201324 RepID=A0A367GNP4_9SPHI|nr:GDSL-type esterase/lipase family protein [Mucilaginibacter hurinus]RCH54291.1 hypothetical protein DJ568_13435 [Mucilaginibacter hurinus]
MHKKIYLASLAVILSTGCKKEITDIRQPEIIDFNKSHLRASSHPLPFWDEIMAFQNQDAKAMPKPNGVLFMGSSTIRLWPDLDKKTIAGQPIIKRGIGGAEMSQFATSYAPFLTRYKPKFIFLYAGGNDVLTGKTPEQITAAFDSVYSIVNRKLPTSNIYYLSLKISPKHLNQMDTYKKTNALIKASIDKKPKAFYLDVCNLLAVDTNGTPDPKYYSIDNVHLNMEGYTVLENALRSWVR